MFFLKYFVILKFVSDENLLIKKGNNMNAEQRGRLLNVIREYEKSDIENFLEHKFESDDVVGNVRFSLFYSRMKRIFKQLKSKLGSDDWEFLPSEIPMPEYGRINLIESLERVVSDIKNRIFKDAVVQVNAVAQYLFACGVWNENLDDKLNANKALLSEIEERMEFLSKRYSVSERRYEEILDLANKESAEINSLLMKAKSEYESSQKAQNELNVRLAEVQGVAKRVEDISEIVTKRKNEYEKIASELSDKSARFSEQLKSSQLLINQAKQKIEDVDGQLKLVEEKSKESLEIVNRNKEETDKNVEYIKKMTGIVANGALGSSFRKRKNSIGLKAYVWLFVSVVLFFAAIWWIWYVFTNLSATTDVVWANILINAIKSSLGVFAFGYALNEYGKERNLQEEYAFKESVALTLTAYLQQLESCDKEEMKNLLIETVNKLYTKPVISTKEYKMMNVDTKDLTEKLQPVVDLVKSVTEVKK